MTKLDLDAIARRARGTIEWWESDDFAPDVLALVERVRELEWWDSEAAKHVETVICMRTGFTGDDPYVGWRGLGLALTEALDERDRLQARVRELEAQLAAGPVMPETSSDDILRLGGTLVGGELAVRGFYDAIRAALLKEQAK